MATLHQIPLDTFAGKSARGGIGLFLASPPARTRIWDFRSLGWEVELRAGSRGIVARTDRVMVERDRLAGGIEFAHRALDLVAITDGDALTTESPATEHILFEDGGPGSRTIRYRSTTEQRSTGSAQLTRYGDKGNVIPQPPERLPDWSVAYRFYRLSQASPDPYSAFRNLFLGLEALFTELFPRHSNEKERIYLLRAIGAAGARIKLDDLATPGAADPGPNIGNQVWAVRNKLFHAKTGMAIIPEDPSGVLEVATAYPLLLELWKRTADAFLFQPLGSGGLTHYGFSFGLGRAFASAHAALSSHVLPAERTLPGQDDLQGPWQLAGAPVQAIETGPGQLTFTDTFAAADFAAEPQVGLIGLVDPPGHALMAASIPGGLTLMGCDSLSIELTVRHRRRGAPKTQFD